MDNTSGLKNITFIKDTVLNINLPSNLYNVYTKVITDLKLIKNTETETYKIICIYSDSIINREYGKEIEFNMGNT